MRGWKLVNVLQEKRVELRDLPEYDQLTQGHEPHVGARGVEPPDRCPTARGELKHHTLELTRGALDVPYADPLVLPHLQDLANLQSHPDPKAVADEHVEDHRVPPALGEVGQQVGERDLSDLPHDAYGPENPQVPYEDGLEGPAEEVGRGEDVQVVPDLLHVYVGAVDPVLLVHVDVEVSQTRVYPDEDLSDGVVVLKQYEQQEHLVEDARAKDYPPDSRVRTREGSIGEGQDGYYQEEESYAEQACPQIVLHIGAVPA